MVFTAETTCADAVRQFTERKKKFCTHACVTGDDGKFAGTVSLQDCLARSADDPVSSAMHDRVKTADLDDTAEEIAILMSDRGIDFVPVLKADGSIAGGVYAPVASRYLVKTLREDAARFAGLTVASQDDYFEHTVWTDFRRRFPWVLILAVAGLAAGYVVHIYEDALDALVILALYMPMVADTGGNVGTQSASLVTRVITTGDITKAMALKIMWREVRVSLMMALLLFTFAFLKVLLISNAGDVPVGLSLEGIGFAIATALAVQVISATLIGAILPLAAISVRQDPAVVSGPALTTIVDLTGLLLYFLITTSMLGIVVVH